MSSSINFFDSLLPLPFRILILINLAPWLWYFVLNFTNKNGIRIFSLLKLNEGYNFQKTKILNRSIICFIGYLIYLLIHEFIGNVGIFWDIYGFFLIFGYLLSIGYGSSIGTNRFRETLKRILIGNIDFLNLRTNDILISDTLVSYGKVFIDLGILICQILNGESCFTDHNTIKINRSCGKDLGLEFLIGSIPILIRLKQCFIEFKGSGNNGHFYNFIKYFIGLIFLGISVFLTKHSNYSTIWKLIAFINSCYSFYWDLNRDWNLFNGKNLRSIKLYPISFYYFAIFFDFFGRFIWIFKLTSTERYLNVILYQSEIGVFMLQILEILRRFIWILIKCEIDYIIMDEKNIELDLLP